MQNASFESVIGSPDVNGMWIMSDTNATTQVPFWTRTETANHPPVGIINGSQYSLPQAGSQGPRYAYASSYVGGQDQVQGFTGTLSASTNVGGTYVLTVAVNALSLPTPAGPAFEVRLRNSGTGVESAPLVSASVPFTPTWGSVTGAVMANGTYDQIVLRYRAVPPGSPWWGIVDDVHLCQVGGGAASATPVNSTIRPSARPTPTPIPTCAVGALNLVQNSSFELVSGSPHVDFGGFGGWWVYEPSGIDTTQVTGWTRTVPAANGPTVVNNGTPGAPQAAAQGSRYAVVPGAYQGLIGTLSNATNVGSTYLLSAEIVSDDSLSTHLFELRLRKSGTGAESAPITQGSGTISSNSWTLVAGTEAANAGYDRVVLRYQSGGFASWLADDVHVCEVASAPVNPPWWPLTGAAVLLAVVLFGGHRLWRSTRNAGAGGVGTPDPLPSVESGGGYDALTDGLLRQATARTDALTDGLLILRTTAPKPLSGTSTPLPSIEGNGTADALTDGLMATAIGPVGGPTVLNVPDYPRGTVPVPEGGGGVPGTSTPVIDDSILEGTEAVSATGTITNDDTSVSVKDTTWGEAVTPPDKGSGAAGIKVDPVADTSVEPDEA